MLICCLEHCCQGDSVAVHVQLDDIPLPPLPILNQFSRHAYVTCVVGIPSYYRFILFRSALYCFKAERTLDVFQGYRLCAAT